MRRRKCREQIFRLLFQEEFFESEDSKERVKISLLPREYEEEEGKPVVFTEDEADYICTKFEAVYACKEALDAILNEVSHDWPTTRMGKVELSILRLALYEMQQDGDVPESVAINEAVELAKKYGGDESYSFINGILSKCAKNQEKRKESAKQKDKPKRNKPDQSAKIVVKKRSASKQE